MKILIPITSAVYLNPIFSLSTAPIKAPKAFPRLIAVLNMPEVILLTFSWVDLWYFWSVDSVISGNMGMNQKDKGNILGANQRSSLRESQGSSRF